MTKVNGLAAVRMIALDAVVAALALGASAMEATNLAAVCERTADGVGIATFMNTPPTGKMPVGPVVAPPTGKMPVGPVDCELLVPNLGQYQRMTEE